MPNIRRQSGIVLIMAILIIAVVLSTAAIFANLIIRDIQQSRLIDQSIQAYYLAESGSERSLYQSRHKEAVKAADCDAIIPGTTCQSDSYCAVSLVPCIYSSKGDLDNVRGDWAINVTNEKETAVNLNVGESFQIDLFSPYQGGGFTTNIQSFQITGAPNAVLYGEVTNLTWLVGGTPACPNNTTIPNPAVSKGPITLSAEGTTGYLTKLVDGGEINPSCSYILRISNNVLPSAAAGKFTLTIYNQAQNVDPATDQLDIPSRLIIDSKAVFGSSQQEVVVRAPTRPPLSGLYDFVLFSEAQIVK